MTNGWKHKELGELCDVIGGGTPPKNRLDFYSGEIPWATVRDMRQDLITETEYCITHEAIKNSATNVIPAGNVVIATRVGLGKVCLLGQDTAINQDLRGIVPRRENLHVGFLYWWLRSVADLIVAEGTGATVQGVKLPFIKSLRMPVPPLSEQQRIAGLLSEAFAGIAKVKGNTERCLGQANLVFEQLLNSQMLRVREGRKMSTVGDVITSSRGGVNIKATDYSDTGVPVLTKGDVKPLGGILHGGKYVDSLTVGSGRWRTTTPGDLIVTTRDLKSSAPFLGLVAQVPEDRAYVVNQGATVFSVDEKQVLRDFFVYWCCSPLYRSHVRSKKVGSTQVHIRQEDLFAAPLMLPSLGEQKNIVDLLDDVSARIGRLRTSYERKLTVLAHHPAAFDHAPTRDFQGRVDMLGAGLGFVHRGS